MRLAVMSDIHGFSLALSAVLDDIAGHGPFDHLVVAGDLCEGGPAPDEVLRILGERPVTVVQGNTDRDLARAASVGAGMAWTRRKIGDAGVRYLGGLPFGVRFRPAGRSEPANDLLVTHANPLDQDRHIPPDASDDQLRALIGDTPAAVIAFGHLHVCYVREALSTLLVDVSAVGNPKDGDLRCKWGEITWDDHDGRWSAELHMVPYPLDETVRQMRASGMPHPDKAIAKLQQASYT